MQVFANSLVAGLLIAVFGLAFNVVYRSTKIFCVGLGGIYIVAPLLAWTLLHRGIALPLALALSTLVGVLLAVASELFNHRRLSRKSDSFGVHFVSSLGIYILLTQGAAFAWGSDTKVLRVGRDRQFRFEHVTLTMAQVSAFVGCLFCLFLFYLLLAHTQLGLRLRATASNSQEAALRGINISAIRVVAFAIAGFLTCVASLLLALDLGFNPTGGLDALLLGVVAAVIGGNSSFWGPVVGGLLLGFLRGQATWLASARWQEVVTFVALAAILTLRPSGLLGRRLRLEVIDA